MKMKVINTIKIMVFGQMKITVKTVSSI